jgi:hypothetical protein
MQHITLYHPIAAKSARVPIIADLEHFPLDISAVRGKKQFDIMSVHGLAPPIAPAPVERR